MRQQCELHKAQRFKLLRGTCYDTIGTYQVPVSDSGWVQIGGCYTVSTTETGLTLYAQLVGADHARNPSIWMR